MKKYEIWFTVKNNNHIYKREIHANTDKLTLNIVIANKEYHKRLKTQLQQELSYLQIAHIDDINIFYMKKGVKTQWL